MGDKGYLDDRNYIADRGIIRSIVGEPDLAVVSQPGSVFWFWDGNAIQCYCWYCPSVVHPPTFPCKWYCDGGSGNWRLYLFVGYKCHNSEMGYWLGFPIRGHCLRSACGFSAIIVRDQNKAIGAVQIAFHTELLKRPEFLLTLAWGCFSVLGYVALLFSIPGYASTVGLTASQGSILGAMFNLGGGLGRPAIGYVSDSFGRLNTALACTFLVKEDIVHPRAQRKV